MSNRFQSVPLIKKPRSVFPLNQTHKTTMNVGDLVPFYVQEVYPGDEFKIDTRYVARLTSSFVHVPFDNLYMDTYYFYVPTRIIDKNFRGVMGENLTGYWAQSVGVYTAPQVKIKDVPVGSLADYLGIPSGSYDNIEVSQYPFRAFAQIWNDWFRNENTQEPVLVDTSASQSTNANAFAPDNIFGMPPRVSKLHDYFTSCLPAPQKGSAVDVPLSLDSALPVVTKDTFNQSRNSAPLYLCGFDEAEQAVTEQFQNGILYTNQEGKVVGNNNDAAGDVADFEKAVPMNLWAELPTDGSVGITVNDMRYAFQLQKLLERDARAGTRYVELLLGHFGVQSPDARLQRAEYLGGNRQPINITQVAQTSQGSESSPQANLAGFSQTLGFSKSNKAFVEHGFIIGVCCIRQKHTYQQGVEKFWFRKSRYDFYDPVFANIGEQPVYANELFLSKENTDNQTVFGYNEAWADLRYRPDRISGVLRSTAPQSLDVWHFGDVYENSPSLNDEFLLETPDYVDRTISVPSTTTPQFMVDFAINVKAIRVMPTYSIPSLIDHN